MPQRSSPGWLVPAVFMLLGLIWGSSFLWIKIAVDELPPATLTAYRMALGAAAMLAFLPFIGQRLPREPGALGHLAVLGLVNAGLPIFLIGWGEQYVESGTAAVLNSLVPIFSLIVAGLILRTEPASALRVAGVLVGFAGAFVLASRELALSGDPVVVGGALAVTAAAASYAVGASYARHRIRQTHRYVVAAGTLFFATVWIGALALVVDGPPILPRQADTLLAVAWLGLLGSFIAYLCYFFLVERLGATVATMVTYVFPVVGVTLGVVFLGELLEWRLALGTLLVVAGMAIVSVRSGRFPGLVARLGMMRR